MLKEREIVVRRAIIAFDVLVIAFAFLCTYFLRRSFHVLYRFDLFPSVNIVSEMSTPFADYLPVAFLSILVWSLVLYLNGMYRSIRTKTLLEVVWVILKSALFTTCIFGAIVFIAKFEFVSRAFFAMFIAGSTSFLMAEKLAIFIVIHFVRMRGYNYRRLLIVGTGKRAADFIQRISAHPEWGIRLIGILDYDAAYTGKVINGVEVLGALGDLRHVIAKRTVDEVIFMVPRAQLGQIEEHLYLCETQGVKVSIAVDLFDLKISHLRQTELDGVPLITFETTPAKEWQLFLKRLADIIFSVSAMVVLSPVFFLAAILVKCTSAGPVFFVQKRVGLNGRKFVLYKFRSMYQGAHGRVRELAHKNEMAGPVFKIKDDPRITSLGKILRKFSIDELPQLFNVFVGQMSIVGPRPPLPKEVSQYQPWQRRRLSMRPGITCLWQISGRSTLSFEEWMRLDLEYIDNWSLWLDFKIIAKTFPVVIRGTGAY